MLSWINIEMKDYFFNKLDLLKFSSLFVLSIGVLLSIDYYLLDQNEVIYTITDKKRSHEVVSIMTSRYGSRNESKGIYVVDIGLNNTYKVSEETFKQVAVGDRVFLGVNNITKQESYLKFYNNGKSYKHFYGGYYFMNGFELFFMLFFFPFQIYHLVYRGKIEHIGFFIVFTMVMEIGYLFYYLF
ncbi:hypothetical protein QW060_11825 [Myroides ceti]|uniref:Uncharacterized protein n=1 Tax=Paenimyroides ceti TaxID=395087 RepID=A0ABT8CXC2_9FLAO|nr:hypothetical protein [Paenimyroides ceti]MDN3707800.1 hypothetical protein [Paenimyroides ceti]